MQGTLFASRKEELREAFARVSALTEAFNIRKLKQEIDSEKFRLPIANGKGLENSQSGFARSLDASKLRGQSQVTAICHSCSLTIHGAGIPKTRTSISANAREDGPSVMGR
jgi:hypothetical protein